MRERVCVCVCVCVCFSFCGFMGVLGASAFRSASAKDSDFAVLGFAG